MVTEEGGRVLIQIRGRLRAGIMLWKKVQGVSDFTPGNLVVLVVASVSNPSCFSVLVLNPLFLQMQRCPWRWSSLRPPMLQMWSYCPPQRRLPSPVVNERGATPITSVETMRLQSTPTASPCRSQSPAPKVRPEDLGLMQTCRSSARYRTIRRKTERWDESVRDRCS